MSSLAEILRKKQEGRKIDNSRVEELAATKAKLARIKKLQEEEAAQVELRRKQEEEEARVAREKAAAEAERKFKTNDYYDFDGQYRRIIPPGSPRYYGDNIKRLGTWVPHGDGTIFFEGKKVYSGNYEQGIMHGIGTIWHPDGSIWEGEFKMGKMHGVGFFTFPTTKDGTAGDREEGLMRDNILICLKKDLMDGVQVEIFDQSTKLANNPSPRVVIQHHNRKWNYKCRFQDEVRPRERNVDFSTLKHFKILHHLPRVYDLSRFNIQTDHPDRYNYWSDTFLSGTRPSLGVAGGRMTAEMKPLNASLLPIKDRAVSLYDENWFESREMGIGLSLIELEQRRFAEKKRQQWDAAVAAKRAEEDKAKQASIEEEQARILEEAAARQQENQRLKKLEDEETAIKMAEEAAKWDAAGSLAQMGSQVAQIRSRTKGREVPPEVMPSAPSEATLSITSIVPTNRRTLTRTLTTKEINTHMAEGSGSVWTLSRSMSQSYLHKKAIRTMSRVDSRYKKVRDADLADQGFETGNLLVLSGYVQFRNPDDDDDIPIFQKIAAYLAFSLDSSGSDEVRCKSVMPLEEEDKRTYQWAAIDLKGVVIPVTADTLDLSSAEVNVMEEVKGRKSISLGLASFNFDAMKKEIGAEVKYELEIIDKNNGDERGVLILVLKIQDTTVYAE